MSPTLGGIHSHPRSLLENWYRAAQDLCEKAEATVRNTGGNSFGEEEHVMNPDLARNLVACRIGALTWLRQDCQAKAWLPVQLASQMSTLRAGLSALFLP